MIDFIFLTSARRRIKATFRSRGRQVRKMNISLSLLIATATISMSCAQIADLPKVASLKPGEQMNVSMTLYGFTITQADFRFTSGKVAIRSKDKDLGELGLTDEDTTRVDEYLDAVRLGEKRRPDQEGYTYEISHSRNQQTQSWTFVIVDARESLKPTLSLHALKQRLEEQEKQKQFDDPADGYFRGFLLLEEAGKTTDKKESIRLLQEADGYFQAVKSRFPNWKTSMVGNRIQQTQELLARRATADR